MVTGLVKTMLKPQIVCVCVCVCVKSQGFKEWNNSVLSVLVFGKWSVDDELRGLTVWGVKLLCSLVVQILLYLFPGGSRVNRLSLWWVLSFSILWALSRHLTSLVSLMLSRRYLWCSAWFKSPAVEPSCPGPWWTVPVFDVSNRNPFYWSSVKSSPESCSRI